MPIERQRVFVSYAHKDSRWKERFETILKPILTNRTEISWWQDGEVEVSEEWHEQIQAALHLADLYVCLVTNDFLASDYIRENELPEMLRRRIKGQADLACLYVKDSLVDLKDFAIDIEPGKTHSVNLTQFQGLNAPDAPIANISSNAEQESALVEAAKRLLDLLAKATRPEAQVTERPAPKDRYPITVAMSWLGDRVACRYFDADQLLLEQVHDGAPYRTAIDSWQRLESTQLSEPEFTDALFRLLFGPSNEDHSNRLLQQVAGASEIDRPIRHAVRVRIYSEDPALRGLPWQTTSYEGQPLMASQWVFELLAHEPLAGYSNEPTINLDHPVAAVILHPGLCGETGTSGGALNAVLTRLRKEFDKPVPRHFAAWQGLRDQLGGVNADLVYFVGRASERDGEILLHFVEGERERQVPARELASIPGLTPKVLFLNLLCPIPLELHGLCAELETRVPIVLVQQAEPVRVDELEQRAADWLNDWQSRGDSPTVALQRKGYWRQASYTAYESFQSGKLQARRIEKDLAVLLLDRHRQREAISTTLRGVVNRSDARLLAALAYADQGNLIERFPEKLLKTLDSDEGVEDIAAVESIKVRWPREGITWTLATLEEALKESLHSDPSRNLSQVLEACRRDVPAKRIKVLLLHWPVLNAWPDKPELEAIVDFCVQRLAPKCPKGVRVLALLLFELEAARHPLVEAFREDLAIDHTAKNVEIVEVDPLDEVKRSDLVRYLHRVETGCDQTLIKSLAHSIVAKTGGAFQATTNLLEEGIQYGWERLQAKLVAEQPA